MDPVSVIKQEKVAKIVHCGSHEFAGVRRAIRFKLESPDSR
jgi:hypothetical protein